MAQPATVQGMLTTKRKLATIGEILTEEFSHPMAITQGALSDAIDVPRKHMNKLCNHRRLVTALILDRVFGNTLNSGSTPGAAPTSSRP